MAEAQWTRQECLRSIPSVEEVLQSELVVEHLNAFSRPEVLSAIRTALDEIRETILRCREKDLPSICRHRSAWMHQIASETARLLRPSLRPLINATGIIVHTNLGRSILAEQALEAIRGVASSYSNLEFDLISGSRGSRYVHLEGILCRLTGAEAATVVNNNAGAVLIALNTLASGRQVVVSRGELVEIGGSFRMPDVMAQSAARLVEVGTTNKTRVDDYEKAIGPETALLLKVHPSNFRILGFTEEVRLEQLVLLGQRFGIPVMNDLGSGCLLDLTDLGIESEPTVQEALHSGADLVTFSGDKLLGGPQAGLILGKREWVERIRGNPLNRALRIDKLTLAALEATLRIYWNPSTAIQRIPTLQMLSSSDKHIRSRARHLVKRVGRHLAPVVRVDVRSDHSQVGGGSFPLLHLPTWVVTLRIEDVSANQLNRAFRSMDPPVIVRVQKDEVLLDMRTVSDGEIAQLADMIPEMIRELSASSRTETMK